MTQIYRHFKFMYFPIQKWGDLMVSPILEGGYCLLIMVGWFLLFALYESFVYSIYHCLSLSVIC